MKDSKRELEETCEITTVHENVVERVRSRMPDEDLLYDTAELFKVFGDSTRTRILSALFIEELCVCDIASLLNMTKSAVSHQLRILRQTKIGCHYLARVARCCRLEINFKNRIYRSIISCFRRDRKSVV